MFRVGDIVKISGAVRKSALVESLFRTYMVSSPRQARNKHTKRLEKRSAVSLFSVSQAVECPQLAATMVRIYP